MALIRRCDCCMTETKPPRMFSLSESQDDWYVVYRPGDEEGLTFCGMRCVTDYFATRKAIEGISGVEG